LGDVIREKSGDKGRPFVDNTGDDGGF
jgi:hypothetical protein